MIKEGCVIRSFFLKLGKSIRDIFGICRRAVVSALWHALSFFKALGKRLYSLFCSRPFIFCAVSAIIIELYIECVSRHSLWQGVKFFFVSFPVFTYGALIILCTLLISLLLKRGIAMYTTVTLIWVILGTANGIILSNRPSPFAAADILILPTVLEIITVYLTVPEIILIAFLLVAAITGIVFMWIKAPKRERSLKRGLIRFCASSALLAAITPTFLFTGVLSRDFTDILAAYERNGFPYSFSRSLFLSGISKPDGYSEKSVSGVLTELNSKSEKNSNFESPNIVYVQLESFFDVKYLKGVTFSEDPVPNFTALKESCPSGFLSVPLCGSGTANTEFEILTGMSTEFFSPGEYPYVTVMRDKVSASAAFTLSRNGYKTHAMHNNTGVFYDRHLVYPNLGFDTFTPIEYMYGVEYNPLGWAKDSVFTEEIRKTLESTEESDFVFAVSVQPHGSYPTEGVTDCNISVSGIDDEELRNMYLYYISQINETDKLIKELTDYYSSCDEKTVIVFYGDHLPDLKLTEDQLKEGDLYQTEYVLWSNYGAFDGVEDKDVEAFQLSDRVFGLLGLNEHLGAIGSAHRYLSDDEDYKSVLHLLEYDTLFGKNYSTASDPYVPSNMTFGIIAPSITALKLDGETLTVSGEGFNQFSVVYISGERYETEYVSENTLTVREISLESGSIVTVAQEADGKEALSFSVGRSYIAGG